MRRFVGFDGEEIVDVGRLDGPGVFITVSADADAGAFRQFTAWLTQEQAVNLAEYLLRCVRKQGDKA